SAAYPDLPPFPTRRSSDLDGDPRVHGQVRGAGGRIVAEGEAAAAGGVDQDGQAEVGARRHGDVRGRREARGAEVRALAQRDRGRSEEHTSELQSRVDLVWR